MRKQSNDIKACLTQRPTVLLNQGYTVCSFFSSYREGNYRYKPGTTAVLSKTVTPLTLDVVDETVQLMDTQWNMQ